MIYLGIKLLEKLVDLAQHRSELNRSFFQDHVNPLYSDTRVIVDDYLGISTEIGQTLTDDPSSLHKANELLEFRRKEKESLRDEVHLYVEVLKQRNNKIADIWIEPIRRLLQAEPTGEFVTSRNSASALLLSRLRLLERDGSYELPRAQLIVDEYRVGIERRWVSLRWGYYTLRESCLG